MVEAIGFGLGFGFVSLFCQLAFLLATYKPHLEPSGFSFLPEELLTHNFNLLIMYLPHLEL